MPTSTWHTGQGQDLETSLFPLYTNDDAHEIHIFELPLALGSSRGSRNGLSYTLESTLRMHPEMTNNVVDSVQLKFLKLPEPAILVSPQRKWGLGLYVSLSRSTGAGSS